MPSSTKNVLINIQANTSQIVGGLASLSAKIDTLNTLFASMNKTSSAAMSGVATSASSASTAMGSLATSVSKTATAMGPLAASANTVLASMSPAKLAAAANAWSNVTAAFNKVKPQDSGFVGTMKEILDPGKIGTAIGYRAAYGIADLPLKAFENIKQTIKTEIDSASAFEGNLYDLKAYLGGASGELLEAYAKGLGRSGGSDQLQAGALTDIQNKILDVGQTTTFTANEIAIALTEAAKAGVTIQELGKPGQQGALDAIALLAQNTGEDLTKSAIITSKLQEAFRSNLDKSQIQFGKTADEAEQYVMVVNALAQADTTSAASASQLTEALFNVGGSANNINMSFFDTLSLVGAMVPAFESAASAGTSLKYVFSRITGANSVKARESMMNMNLMDESGQSVFFDQKGFKGMEFMVRKLRETFGDQAGMAVDVRNRIITEIFGQDAQKAISRMVSMTEDQAQDMYKAASSMTQNASMLGEPGSVNFAQQTANIKNEGLEYDLEFLKGSLDSISKTLSVPLLKPMSAVTQSISGFANGMFAVLKGGEDETQGIKNALDMIDTKMLPNSMVLFDKAIDYARTLKIGLDAIAKEGFNTNSIATALAALLGTEKKFMAVRVEEYKVLLTQVYNGIGDFIKKLPEYLDQLKTFVTYFAAAITKGFGWLVSHWDEVVEAAKIIAVVMVANWAVSAAHNWMALGDAVAKYIFQMNGLKGAAQALPAVTQNNGLLALLTNGISGLFAGNNWTNVFTGIQTGMSAMKINWINTVTAMSTAWAGFTTLLSTGGLGAVASSALTGLAGALGALLSPLAIAALLIAGLAAAWYFNVGGIQEWMMTEFGSTIEYVQQTFGMIYDAVIGAWTSISAWFKTEGGTDFLMSFSNILKMLTVMIQGLVLIIGGVLKTLVGLLTLNGDLIGSGLVDIFNGVYNILSGVMAYFTAMVQGMVSGVVQAINWASNAIGLGDAIDKKGIDNLFNALIDKQTSGGMKTGIQYAAGIALGLRGGKKDVGDATSELTTLIKTTTSKDLEVRSPSEYAIRDGEFYGSGLAEGLYNSIPVVQEAALAVTDALKDTVKSNLVNNMTRDETQIVFNSVSGITIPQTVTPEYVKSGTSARDDAAQKLKNSQINTSYYDRYGKTGRDAQTDSVTQNWYNSLGGIYGKIAKDQWAKEYKLQENDLKKGVPNNTQMGWYKTDQSFFSSKTIGFNLDKLIARLNNANPGSGTERFGRGGGGYRNFFQMELDEKGNAYVKDVNGRKEYIDTAEKIFETSENHATTINKIMKNVMKQMEIDAMVIKGARAATSDIERYIKSTTDVIKKNTFGVDKTDGMRIEGARGSTSDVMRYVNSGGYGDVFNSLQQNIGAVAAPIIRQMTAKELANRGGPGYVPVTQLPVQSMRGDFTNLPLDQFSTDTYDVAKNVKQFQFTTEGRAIEQRGLSGIFQNKDVAAQYLNIGNRAATYLSMHQGQLKPEEVTVFQDLLARDRADRVAYLDAVKKTKEEADAIANNPLLSNSEKQKQTKSIWSNFFEGQKANTQSFKDVYNVKSRSMGDYNAEMGGAADQFAKLGPQAFNEALSVALNPANQSEAFKALSPEAQAKLVDQAKNLPSQAMSFLTDAMSDGTLTATEFDTYMAYAGEDIKNMRAIISRGTPPTQEEMDAFMNPFIDGLATVVKTSDITGILGTQFGGAMNVLFNGMGKKAWNDFLAGWMTDAKGNKVKISSLNFSEILGFTPENITKYGIPVGTNISTGIIEGIKQSIVTNQPLLNNVIRTDFVEATEEAFGIESPSTLMRDTIGLKAGLGIADGLVLEPVKTALGLRISSLFNPFSEEAYMMAIMASIRLLGSAMGSTLVDEFALTLQGKSDEKGNATFSIGLAIIDTLKQVFEEKEYTMWAQGIGFDFARGMAQGVLDGKSVLTAAINKIIADALQNARDENGVNSPSLVFADLLGSPLVEGIAHGISKNGNLVGDALNPLLDNAANYRPDISGIALNGAMRRSQMRGSASSTENNYNLSLTSSYPGQTVQQQFEIMRAFKGR
jgi:TP901 family phage tail tape measure protein